MRLGLILRGIVREFRRTGYRGSQALFDPWYSLLREKRKWKLDFLKAILRAFTVDPAAGTCAQNDVDLARYVAENLSVLDYKTQEEVFALVSGLDRLLADAGLQTCHLLEERLDEAVKMDVDDGGEQRQGAFAPFAVPLLRRHDETYSHRRHLVPFACSSIASSVVRFAAA